MEVLRGAVLAAVLVAAACAPAAAARTPIQIEEATLSAPQLL